MAFYNELEELQGLIIDFINDLKDSIFTSHDEQGDLVVVEFFFKRMHPERVMNHAIQHILPYKKVIQEKRLSFFLDNRKIFAGLPDDRVDYYSNILVDPNRVDEEDRESIWAYFDEMVRLAENYKKKK